MVTLHILLKIVYSHRDKTTLSQILNCLLYTTCLIHLQIKALITFVLRRDEGKESSVNAFLTFNYNVNTIPTDVLSRINNSNKTAEVSMRAF